MDSGQNVDSQGVKVFARFRPINSLEKIQTGNAQCVKFISNKLIKVSPKPNFNEKHTIHEFEFDNVFDCESKQIDVFDNVASAIVKDVLSGYNSSIIAYGQTGSGKTFTMQGELKLEETYGLTPRIASKIFENIHSSSSNFIFTIKANCVEIYLESVRDLFKPNLINLHLREGSNGIYVQGATDKYITTLDDLMSLVNIAASNRSISSTRMNDNSSRSHSIFSIEINAKDTQKECTQTSKLLLVDLAGSEKADKSDLKMGSQMKQLCHINRSLSALGNVILSLTSNRQHIPYRDSKLTFLLSSSLGGNSKSSIIITCSSSLYNYEETISTLRFGTCAKAVKNRPTINQELSISEYKRLISKLNITNQNNLKIIKQLKSQLTSHNISINNLDNLQDSSFCNDNINLELERTISEKKDLENKINILRSQVFDSETQIETLQNEIEDLKCKIYNKNNILALYETSNLQVIELRSQINNLNTQKLQQEVRIIENSKKISHKRNRSYSEGTFNINKISPRLSPQQKSPRLSPQQKSPNISTVEEFSPILPKNKTSSDFHLNIPPSPCSPSSFDKSQRETDLEEENSRLFCDLQQKIKDYVSVRQENAELFHRFEELQDKVENRMNDSQNEDMINALNEISETKNTEIQKLKSENSRLENVNNDLIEENSTLIKQKSEAMITLQNQTQLIESLENNFNQANEMYRIEFQRIQERQKSLQQQIEYYQNIISQSNNNTKIIVPIIPGQ